MLGDHIPAQSFQHRRRRPGRRARIARVEGTSHLSYVHCHERGSHTGTCRHMPGLVSHPHLGLAHHHQLILCARPNSDLFSFSFPHVYNFKWSLAIYFQPVCFTHQHIGINSMKVFLVPSSVCHYHSGMHFGMQTPDNSVGRFRPRLTRLPHGQIPTRSKRAKRRG